MRTIICWLLLAGLFPLIAAEPARRLAAPDEEAEKAATALISDLYKANYAVAKSPEQKIALAKKLLADAAGTADNMPAKYVLYRISRDIATQQGEVSLAFESIDQMAGVFDVDALDMKSEAVIAAGKV